MYADSSPQAACPEFDALVDGTKLSEADSDDKMTNNRRPRECNLTGFVICHFSSVIPTGLGLALLRDEVWPFAEQRLEGL
jgi:hypothetical protein